jgi:hypothetical protein
VKLDVAVFGHTSDPLVMDDIRRTDEFATEFLQTRMCVVFVRARGRQATTSAISIGARFPRLDNRPALQLETSRWGTSLVGVQAFVEPPPPTRSARKVP